MHFVISGKLIDDGKTSEMRFCAPIFSIDFLPGYWIAGLTLERCHETLRRVGF